MSERDIVLAALTRSDPGDRSAYLDDACGTNASLRRRVEAMLRATDQPAPPDPSPPIAPSGQTPEWHGPTQHTSGNLPAPDPDAFIPNDPTEEGPGTRIGPYKLLERIGAGGMGVVYLAEQEAPVRRRVALKVIKPGMDTKYVVARFEAERQALAMMDHQNIARVFDGSATASGRPYFVMELVKGVPITDYCDQACLTVRERLELFASVLAAIQHAHQKGIIHRDIKPSNVLVTVSDDRPIPKVIDFGIAKATNQPLTEKTLFTQHGSIIGTLEYMSPEQSDMTGLDVDTRSDIYSLGVLLYELLTGSTPLGHDTLKQAAYHEVLRRIRDEEPPKPSTRLDTSTVTLPTVSGHRGVESGRLSKLLRGELDWIVMKALEKDRTRRYETATGFARDIQRYLADEPVEASPPSASYRLRKFARKHRAILATAAGFATLLLLGIAVSTWEAIRASTAEDRAVKARDRAVTAESLAQDRLVAVERANAETGKALDASRQAEARTAMALKDSEQARAEAEAVNQLLIKAFRKPDPALDGMTLKVVDVLDQAIRGLDAEFAGSPRIKGELLSTLGRTYFGLGLPARAINTFEQARSIQQAELGADHPSTLATMNNLAIAYDAAGRIDEARTLQEQEWKLRAARLGPDHATNLTSMSNLAVFYRHLGRNDEALKLQEQELKLCTAKLGPDHSETFVSMNNLAVSYGEAGRVDDAIKLHERVLELKKAKLGPDHPATLTSMTNLAVDYRLAGRIEDALKIHEQALELARAKLGPDHPSTLMAMNNLAVTYSSAGRNDDSIRLNNLLVAARKARLGPDHPDTLISMGNLAIDYNNVRRLGEAIALHEQVSKLRSTKLGPDHPETLASLNNLALSYQLDGRAEDALRVREQVMPLARARFGPGHPETIANMNKLASAYFDLGKVEAAASLVREILPMEEKAFGPESPNVGSTLALLSMSLVKQKKDAEAEPVLRRCLAIREKTQPDDWSTFNTRGMLGGTLLARKAFAEAEPLIVQGYEGMKARETKIPPTARARITEAGERTLKLYDAWGKPEKADEWRAKLKAATSPTARPPAR